MIFHFLQAPYDHQADREDRDGFEKIIFFLQTVPVFKKRLPPSIIPQVARSLGKKEWYPGEILAKQGDIGSAFFLIQSGKALVTTRLENNDVTKDDEVECGTLVAGDYFGGHTLTSTTPNVATIRVSGLENLVTLSISRTAFEELGLNKHLNIPSREAIAVSRWQDAMASPRSPCGRESSLDDDEQQFLINVTKKNPNLRALAKCDTDVLQNLAKAATRRTVRKGAVIAQEGVIGHEFIVLREGCLEVTRAFSDTQTSAEEAVAKFGTAGFFSKKSEFLATMNGRKQPCSRMSAVISPKARRPSMKSHRRGSLHPDSAPSRTKGQRLSMVVSRPGQSRFIRSAGDSFGELSLFYNIPHAETISAASSCVVYAVPRKAFNMLRERSGPRIKEYDSLLERVPCLKDLLSHERWELACSALGLVHFKPYERVLSREGTRGNQNWFVAFEGSGFPVQPTTSGDMEAAVNSESCFPSSPKRLKSTGTLVDRQISFGRQPTGESRESIKRPMFLPGSHLCDGADCSECTTWVAVDAGPDGMVCLAFDFDLIQPLVASNDHPDAGGVDDAYATIWLHDLYKIRKLGKGSFGEVSLVWDCNSGQTFALKRLRKDHIEKQDAGICVKWEREMLTMLDSPFVIKLCKSFHDVQSIYFLMEASTAGDLAEAMCIHQDLFLNDSPRGSTTAFYTACIVLALEHLHERHIVYRDLKLQNCLIANNGYAKLCDMGFARFVLGKTCTLCGSPEYMSPEMIDFPHIHGLSTDWWSLGVLVYELMTGQTPFCNQGIEDVYESLAVIRRCQDYGPFFPAAFPRGAKDFVTELLAKRPSSRLGYNGPMAVQRHPMFQRYDINFDDVRNLTYPSPFLPCDKWDDEGRHDEGYESFSDSDSDSDIDDSEGIAPEWTKEFGPCDPQVWTGQCPDSSEVTPCLDEMSGS